MGTSQQQKCIDELGEAYSYWKAKDQSRAGQIAKLLLQRYGNDHPLIKKLGL